MVTHAFAVHQICDRALALKWQWWLAYFLIVAAASIPVRVVYAIWLRTPMAVDLSEVIINAVMLA
ncbi:phage holin family protein, partial [Escherichia coli]|uniref:phage holin family protein n=1 Tax=Escherichia coli TaxID=562 RepID=UPI003EDECAC4